MSRHFSTFDISGRRAELLFPGAGQITQSYGYVRSETRAALAGDAARSRPWRDYPDEARIDTRRLLDGITEPHVLIIGARNVANEYGYAARINGIWHQRAGDRARPEHWPYVEFAAAGLRFIHRLDAPSGADRLDADRLTGVPIVINGTPIGREDVVRYSSDVAHTFHVHPHGAIGPPIPAWEELSEIWETCHQLGTDPVASLLACGRRYGAHESKHLLWSVLVENATGGVMLAAITGSLPTVGQTLIGGGARNAIVLDAGGSVGWWYRKQPQDDPLLLLAGPNYRATGLVFIRIYLDIFPQPQAHGALST